MSEMSRIWFSKARGLEVGQSVYIRVANIVEQVELMKELDSEKKEFSAVDPALAAQIFILKKFQDGKLYVVLERRYRTVFTGFVRSVNGAFTKVSVDPERYRAISLMVKDLKTKEEVELTVGELSSDELAEFFPSEQSVSTPLLSSTFSRDWVADVKDFMTKVANQEVVSSPSVPEAGVQALRQALIAEEINELMPALITGDLVEIADGIVDSIVVLIGTALAYGIDLHEVWLEVHRSNMSKQGGEIRYDGKILKPEWFVPPDIAGVIARQRNKSAE